MTTPNRPRTVWIVTHPELFIRIEVPARTPEEAQRVAWERWYQRPVRTELDELMRAAFATEDTRKPAEQGPRPVAGGAKMNSP